MDSRLGAVVALAVVGLSLVALPAVVPPTASDPGGYNRTTVTLVDDDGARLATVDVRVADTRDERYLGLSDTESLADGEGMLFVHPREARHTYVMRRMDFPLDIVFVAANGTVTRIHHAPVPEKIPGGNGKFPGVGRFVLEVPRGYANQTGLDVGDRVVVPDRVVD